MNEVKGVAVIITSGLFSNGICLYVSGKMGLIEYLYNVGLRNYAVLLSTKI